MKLADLQKGETAIITKVNGIGAFRKRITEMGFVKGQNITVVGIAPLKDPIKYKLMDYEISLRLSEASLIEVVNEKEAKSITKNEFNGVLDLGALKKAADQKSKHLKIALVGNPNCGKTTLFNKASGSNFKVGNYSGVTVGAHKAKFKYNDYNIELTDLPGTYSMTAYSTEELYVRNHIINEQPDIVINVIDASNIERNLYLTTQLIDMDIKVVVALNMYDELNETGAKLDHDLLGKMLGIPFVPTISKKNKGIDELIQKAIDVCEDNDEFVRHIHVNYGQEIETSIQKVQELIKTPENKKLTDQISSRYLSLKLIENDNDAIKKLNNYFNKKIVSEVAETERKRLEKEFQNDSETIISNAKYGFINGALKETYTPNKTQQNTKTNKIDKLLMHRFLGLPIFAGFIWLMFQSTFTIGQFPMDWINQLVAFTGDTVSNLMPDGMLKDLLVDGIIGGVGGVIVFLPNILILFLFISFMEDTGYIARASFLMDKFMHKIGLHGKSFIPMIMGFGCNVPAIMSTRMLESKNNRLLTMLINPFMSCSARLPVYILLIGAFFPNSPGLILFSIYSTGIILAIIFALIFKKTFFSEEEVPFVMELPPYRLPTLQSVIKHMWEKAGQYLKKMGGLILIASIIIWALSYFPTNVNFSKDYDTEISVLEQKGNSAEAIRALELERDAEKIEQSYIGKIGHTMEPVLKPLGFDWKMGISIVTGAAAKEVIISTMGVLYQVDDDVLQDTKTLTSKLQNSTYQSGDKKGQKSFTPLVAFSFMIFVLIYFPCISTIAAIRKESGEWKWAILSMTYTCLLAYVLSLAVYQIGSLFV